MKRFWVLITLLLITGYVFAQSAPSVSEQNRIKFTVEGQMYSSPFAISSIAWTSASGDEIGATGGFILQDLSYNDIASCEATTVSDQCQFSFSEPLVVDGLFVSHLDGDIYVYGKRR